MKALQKIGLMALASAAMLPSEGHEFLHSPKLVLNTDKISISGKPNRKRGKCKPNQFKKRKGK